MGYKYQVAGEKAGTGDYRMLEVVLVKQGSSGMGQPETRVVAVDNQWDTLRFVQEHMDDFIGNLVQVRKMDEKLKKIVEENSRLFEKNLGPLFATIANKSKQNVMVKLSSSLKKALLMMALDRYHCDKETICQALGISRDKLERELRSCGIVTPQRKAA